MTDLIDCIADLKKALADIPAAPPVTAENDSWERWKAARDAAAAKLTAAIETMPKGSVRNRWDGCKVKIMGVQVSSTMGIESASRNWIAAARRKLDKTGFIQASTERESVR